MSVNLGTAIGYLDLDTTRFTRGFASARTAMNGFSSNTQTFSSKARMVGTAMQSVGSTLTKTVTPAIALFGASAIKAGSSFESAMSQVAATMGKPKKEIKDLEKAAIEMGSKTSFTATQAAEALNYLALAGYDSKQQIAALPKVLDLAQAGNMDLAKASDMLTDSMSALGLTSKDTGVLMTNMQSLEDKMAKTASKANTSVGQLGEAILTVGGTAKNLKGGTTELSTVLGVLADNSIKASEGGIHLRNIILAMTPSTKKAKEAFKELGVEAYENGKLRAIPDIFLEIKDKMDSTGMSMEKQTKLLSKMFKETDLAAVNALLGTSKDRWDELSDAIDNSKNAASEMAKMQKDNLQGDVERLMSSIEKLQIRFYELGNKGLRSVVQFINSLVDKFNSLSDAQLEMVEKIALIAAAIGPVLIIGGKIITMVSGISKVITTLNGLSTVFSGLSIGASAFSSVLLPIAAIIAGIVGAVIAFKAAWDENFGGIRESAKSIFDSVGEIFQNIYSIFKDIVGSMRESWDTDFSGIAESAKTIVASIVSILSSLVKIVSDIVTTIKKLWDDNFLGIKDIVTVTLNAIVQLFSGWLNYLANIIKGISKLFSGDFKGAMDSFSKAFSGLNTTIKNVFEKIKNVFSSLVNSAKNFLKSLVDLAKTKMSEFADKMKQGALNAKDKFIQFMKELPRNAGVLLGQVIGKVVSFAVNFVKESQKSAKDFSSKLINGIKNLPSNIQNLLSNIINKVKQFAINFPENAAKAAKQFVEKLKAGTSKATTVSKDLKDKVVNAIRELPHKFTEIATQAVAGLINGFKNKLNSAKKAISDFAGGIVSGFKSALDIHSPSRVMEKQVGEQIANGVIKGIKAKKNAGKKEANKYASELVSAAKKGLQAWENVHGDLSLKQEENYWKKILSKLKKGSSQYISAYTEYTKVIKKEREKQQKEREKQSKKDEELLNKYKNKWENYSVYNKTTLKEEMDYWDKARKQFKKGTEERIEADKKYFEVKKEYNEKIKDLDEKFVQDEKAIHDELEKSISELNEKYNNAVEERKRALLSSFDLFKEYSNSEEATSQGLMNSLESQVKALTEYNESLNSLSGRNIIPEDLLKEIKDMGVNATSQIKALNEMTDEELQNYVELWETRMSLATEQATKELEPLKEETTKQIEELKEASNKKLLELRFSYISELTELGVESSKAAKKAGIKTIKEMIKGIDSVKGQLNNDLKSVTKDLTKSLNDMLKTTNSKTSQILSSLRQVKTAAIELNRLNESSISTIGSIAGSHKIGLDYVPYDGYIAKLHKGEAVLTAQENKQRGNDVSGNTFIFNGTPPLDEKETARQFKKVQQELALGF